MIEVIAQASGAAATTQATEAPWIIKMMSNIAFPIAIMLVVMMFLTKNKGGKTDKERQELLKGLKKGDRVVTIGGQIGTVVSADDSEVLLKVDESTNTKIKFLRTAIHRVLEPS